MTPDQFIAKWSGVTLKERSASQSHFYDLCQLLEEPDPVSADPTGTWYCFEKGAKKTSGGEGWADVWKRGHFGWEYKGPGKDLNKALQQLQTYIPALEHPPLLIVSDSATIEIHTAFTGTVPEVHRLSLEDLRDGAKRRVLKWAFSEPERLRPTRTTAQLTAAAAGRFGELAQRLRERGHAPAQVAHFSQQILFCLFAEDIDLLPRKLFSRLLEAGEQHPAHVPDMLHTLFSAMASGGLMGLDPIDWFNGGLFDAPATLPLTREDIQLLRSLAELDWSAIEPSILGTLFERGLDPDKRAQLGAHYTDPASIMRLVDPVVLDPLRAQWERVQAQIAEQMEKAERARSTSARTKRVKAAQTLMQTFLDRLARFRVLDPACGSGNFLLLALLGLKDLEHRALLEAETLGLPQGFPQLGPENVLGIELNPYAAELARVTVWIGEIQWMLAHGFSLNKNPILKPLDTITQRDALLNADGTEAQWPEADVIVGNPPFLGDKKMLGALGEDYVKQLRARYKGRVPGGADLVTYWFEKARAQIEAGKVTAAGLVATNSIRGGANRKVLERICETGVIFNAWSDEPWVNEGAAVRVSLVAFGHAEDQRIVMVDGQPAAKIQANLTASLLDSLDNTQAQRLPENAGVSFMGVTKSGPFDIPGNLARSWLTMPNPHGRPNSDVLFPSFNGRDLASRPSGEWIISFGMLSEADASLYEEPFAYALSTIKPARLMSRTQKNREIWWRFERPRPEMFAALSTRLRYIATNLVGKHRIFQWLPKQSVPENVVIVIARADDTTFGILHSRVHELWSLRLCTWLGKGNDPRYTPTTTFETFPFPAGLTPADTNQGIETLNSGAIIPKVAPEFTEHARAIAEAAHRLNSLRENWLNPPEWVERVPEVVPGYPQRIMPRPEHETDLKARTLTKLYNARPAWLENAHRALDAAVAAAYGWDDDSSELPESEILRRLLALNLERARLACGSGL